MSIFVSFLLEFSSVQNRGGKENAISEKEPRDVCVPMSSIHKNNWKSKHTHTPHPIQVIQAKSLTTSHQTNDGQPEQQLLWKDFPSVLLLSLMLKNTEYLLSQFGSDTLAVSPHTLFHTPVYLLGQQSEKQRRP